MAACPSSGASAFGKRADHSGWKRPRAARWTIVHAQDRWIEDVGIDQALKTQLLGWRAEITTAHQPVVVVPLICGYIFNLISYIAGYISTNIPSQPGPCVDLIDSLIASQRARFLLR